MQVFIFCIANILGRNWEKMSWCFPPYSNLFFLFWYRVRVTYLCPKENWLARKSYSNNYSFELVAHNGNLIKENDKNANSHHFSIPWNSFTMAIGKWILFSRIAVEKFQSAAEGHSEKNLGVVPEIGSLKLDLRKFSPLCTLILLSDYLLGFRI